MFNNSFIKSWKNVWKNPSYKFALLFSVLFFVFSLLLDSLALHAFSSETGPPLKDLLLDNLPVVNLNIFYTYGVSFFVGVFVLYVLRYPTFIPFSFYSAGLLLIVRRVFSILTRMGIHQDFLNAYNPADYAHLFGPYFNPSDFFFSGHTAIMFLMFLILSKHKIKWMFLFGSVLMGVTVLFMHVHYSNDVLGAYFVTYTVYILSKKIFPVKIES